MDNSSLYTTSTHETVHTAHPTLSNTNTTTNKNKSSSRGRSEDIVPAMMRSALWAAITSSNIFPTHIIHQFDPLFSPNGTSSTTATSHTTTLATAVNSDTGKSHEYLQFAQLESVQNMATKLRTIIRQHSTGSCSSTNNDSCKSVLSGGHDDNSTTSMYSSSDLTIRERLQREVVALQIDLSKSEAGRLTAELKLRETRVQLSSEKARLVAENERLRLNLDRND